MSGHSLYRLSCPFLQVGLRLLKVEIAPSVTDFVAVQMVELEQDAEEAGCM